jgi:hypothetical protein
VNRITEHAAKLRTIIADKHAGGHGAVMDDLEVTLAIDASEHFAFQEAQARAHVEGKLSMEEALVIYDALGEIPTSKNGGWQPHVDLALKATITQTITELLKQRIGAVA